MALLRSRITGRVLHLVTVASGILIAGYGLVAIAAVLG